MIFFYVALSVPCGALIYFSLIIFLFISNKPGFKFEKNFFFIKKIFLSSIPFTLAAAAHVIYMRVDILMIEFFMDYSSVAIYSISTQLMSLAIIFLYPIQNSIFPYLLKYRNKGDNLYFQYYKSFTSLITYIGLTIALLGIILIKPFIIFFFTEEYSIIPSFFFIHMITAVIIYNAVLRSSHITLIGKGYILLYSQIISLVLNILLNYFLIPMYGLSGAAYSTLFTIFVSLLLSNYFYEPTRPLIWLQIKSFSPRSIISIKKYLFHENN